MSNDPFFDDIMKELQAIHEENPDMRFGSVLQTAVDAAKKKNNSDLFDLSSKEILVALKSFNQGTKEKRVRKIEVLGKKRIERERP